MLANAAFFAIVIYWINDYKAAEIPVLPIKRGFFYTKVNMLVFVILYIAASIMLGIIAVDSLFYLISAVALVLIWLLLALQGFVAVDIIFGY